MKSYNKIPQTVRSNPASALIFYIEQFDGLFGVFLKQKEPQDLEGAFREAIKMENHFTTANQAKIRLQKLLDPQGKKASQGPSQSLAQPFLEEPKKEEEDLSSNPQVVSLLQDLVQKLSIQDKSSHQPSSSQRPLNQQRKNFQAHRNFENLKNPNPSPGVNFVGKNSHDSNPYCRACDMPHPEETCQLFAQYAHVFLGSDSHEDNMVNMAGEFHEDVEDS